MEKNDCVHVPGKEQTGWNIDKLSDLPTKPSKTFNMVSLQGVYIHILIYIPYCPTIYVYSMIYILNYIYLKWLYIYDVIIYITE